MHSSVENAPEVKVKNHDLEPDQLYESPDIREMRDSFRLSTQLFNGDYLTAQAAEDSSKYQSRNFLPHQFLLDASNASMGKSSQFDQSGHRRRGGGTRK